MLESAQAVTASNAPMVGGDGRKPSGQPVLLVATPETIGSLRSIVSHTTRGIEAAGVVLLGDAGPILDSNLPVESSLDKLASLCERTGAGEILASLPGPGPAQALRAAAGRLGVPIRFIPTADELIHADRFDARAGIRREGGAIDLAGLVGRDAHEPDSAAIASIVSGKRVLVTGAGGSIGSELCRVCAAHKPGEIALVERSENSLFEIDRQLASKYPGAVATDPVARRGR